MEDDSPATKKVISLLSEMMGVDSDDISIDDSFVDDLNMEPSQLSDFIQLLNNNNIDTSDIVVENIETVGELVEELGLDELI